MAVSAWAASTAFSVGDIRRAVTDQATGLWFRCTAAGTSGSSQTGQLKAETQPLTTQLPGRLSLASTRS